MDRPGHVGVVGPAQVQVKVTVGLRDTQRRSREGKSLRLLTVHTLIHRLIGAFTARVRRGLSKTPHTGLCLMSPATWRADNPAAHTAQREGFRCKSNFNIRDDFFYIYIFF